MNVDFSESDDFETKVPQLSDSQLYRDLSEIVSNILFLGAQMDADFDSYSSCDLIEARKKIELQETKQEMLMAEALRRKHDQNGPSVNEDMISGGRNELSYEEELRKMSTAERERLLGILTAELEDETEPDE
jgi:hypothetical protein